MGDVFRNWGTAPQSRPIFSGQGSSADDILDVFSGVVSGTEQYLPNEGRTGGCFIVGSAAGATII